MLYKPTDAEGFGKGITFQLISGGYVIPFQVFFVPWSSFCQCCLLVSTLHITVGLNRVLLLVVPKIADLLDVAQNEQNFLKVL